MGVYPEISKESKLIAKWNWSKPAGGKFACWRHIRLRFKENNNFVFSVVFQHHLEFKNVNSVKKSFSQKITTGTDNCWSFGHSDCFIHGHLDCSLPLFDFRDMYPYLFIIFFHGPFSILQDKDNNIMQYKT